MECNINTSTKVEVLEEGENCGEIFEKIEEVIAESNNIVPEDTQKTEIGKHCRLDSFLSMNFFIWDPLSFMSNLIVY